MKNDKTIKNVVLWARVSSTEQGDRYSLPAQEKELVDYCKVHNLNVVRSFSGSFSGFNFKEPMLQSFLDFITDNKVDAVLFTENDRLMRDLGISGYIKILTQEKGIQLIGINEELKSSTPTEVQELTDSILVIIKKFEIERKNRRCKRGRDLKFEQGGHITKTPYGYKNITHNNRKNCEPDQNTINVQNMFRDYIKQDENGKRLWGYHKLAIKLKLFNKEGKPMPMTVRGILTNPFYIGYICRTNKETGKKEWKKGIHNPIIEQDVFYQIPMNNKWRNILK